MLIENPWTQLREMTAARIALGRAGHSLPTRELLAFQLAHAKARDAVWRGLDASSLISASLVSKTLAALNPIYLHSAARDRAEYLRRPDLGRKLAPESASRLVETRTALKSAARSGPGEWDAVIVIADGLSALAVHRHAIALMEALLRHLHGWRIAPVCVVEQGRVAIADDIGERMGAAMALVILGERPGLSSPDSLGAYLTWSPRVGRTDAERNCVSNIRAGGLDPEIAAMRIAQLMQVARQQRLTGVGLSIAPALA
jgi:ethanolamine ammonia-lyase small subunit